MFRGLIIGSVAGGAVSVFGLALVSLLAEAPQVSLPAEPAPVAETPVETPAAETAATVEEAVPVEVAVETAQEPAPVTAAPSQPVQPATDGSGILVEAPTMVAPSTGTDAASAVAETETADKPADPVVELQLSAPETGDAPDTAMTEEEPVFPAPLAPQPSTPGAENDIVVTTESTTAVVILPESITGEAGEGEGAAAEEPAAEVAEEAVTEEAATEEPVTETPAVEEQATEVPATEETVTEEVATEEQPAEEPAARPAVGFSGTPASTMPSGNSGVTIRRPGAAAEAPAEDPLLATGPALKTYAAEATVTEGVPMMSVIVIDDGALPNGPSLLRTIPFPVTVAIDPTDANALEKAEAYRDAGFEVAAVAKLPDGAVASDAAMILEATFAALPESVFLLDAGDNGGSRQAFEAVMDRLAEDGRGFVSTQSGLSAPLRQAATVGVPNASVVRDLDADGQSNDVIRRFLDRAAFQARQQSGVIMLARLRAETVTALTIWSTANRASQVSLVPASAILIEQLPK